MHVLIKMNDTVIVSVTPITQPQVGKSVKNRADDIIRAELAEDEDASDIDYEDGYEEEDNCVGRWAAGEDDRWELWKI